MVTLAGTVRLALLLDSETANPKVTITSKRPLQNREVRSILLRVGFPTTNPDCENIEITGLKRGAVIEPFKSLSLGTREQLAVLARIAFADLLREKGQPAAVILDDAIVFADEERFDNMMLILTKAAKNLQVL